MRFSIVGFLLLVSVSQDTPEHAELDRHQGVWQAVAFVRDGESTPKAIVETITRTVEGDHVVWKRDGKAFAGTTLKLEPTADPKHLEVVPDGGPSRDKTVLGIYKLEGETLTICMADPDVPRPSAFEAPKGSLTTLMTFRKVEPAPSGKKPRPPM